MSKRNDSLVMVEGPDRVNYATGVLLNAEDFIAEQNYHRGRLARALAYANGYGTVAGLELSHEAGVPPENEDDEGRAERIMIDAGLAIDRLGRLIEVQQHLCIRIGEWYLQQSDNLLRQSWSEADLLGAGSPSGVVVDVFIRFIACERDKTPAFIASPFDNIDAVTAARLRDGYQTELVLRQEATPPLPEQIWPDFSALPEEDRPAALHTAIFEAWKGTSQSNNLQGLDPLEEHIPGQDTSSLLLARLIIPADEAVGDEAPARRGEAITIQNEIRPFVVSSNALARMIGIM